MGFLAAAVCIALPWQGRLAANLLAGAMMLRVLFLYLPRLLARLHDPGPWTSMFEVLGMGGAAFVIAGSFSVTAAEATERDEATNLLEIVGRYLFAVSLVVFGVQHFMYAAFVGTLVPAWIPWHLFWAYATGTVFFAVAASLMIGRLMRLSAGGLAAMFLLWVLLLHGPRVEHALRNGDEWTSAAVALAMGGGALVIAAFFGEKSIDAASG